MDEFISLGSKTYSCRCGIVFAKIVKGFYKSQPKIMKLEENYNCLFGGEYQKNCDKYFIKSINHDIFFQ